MKQALERRLGIVFGSGVVILFLMGLLQTRSVIDLAHANRDAALSHDVVENLATLRSLLADASLGAQGYAMSGDETYLEGYRTAVARIPGVIQNLQPAGRLDRQSDWVAVTSGTATALDELRKVAEERRASRSRGPSLAASRQAVDGARQAIGSMLGKERDRLNQQKRAVTANSRLAALSTTLGTALGLWLLIVASLVIHRYVAERRSGRGTQLLAMEVLRKLDLAVYLVDETGMVLYANRAADTTFGYPPGKLVGIDVTKLNNLSKAEDGHTLFSQIHTRLSTGSAWTGILTGYNKDRASFLSSARVSALELSGKSYWLFAQNNLARPEPCADLSEINRKHSPDMLEPAEALPVEPASR